MIILVKKEYDLFIFYLNKKIILLTGLVSGEQFQQINGELYDLGAAQLRFAVESIDERDRHLADRVAKLAGEHDDLHLKNVAFRTNVLDTVEERLFSVQSKAARRIADARPK